jgi:hypothetical protein
MLAKKSFLLTLGLCAALAACHEAPTSPATVSEGPDPFEQTSSQSSSVVPSSLESTGAPDLAKPASCDDPTIQYVAGACADGPSAVPTHASIMGTCFTPNKEAALVMAPNTNGFIKGGKFCNGTVFEIGEPFVLPPTFAKTDAEGSFLVVVTGQECWVEALDFASCETSNALDLGAVD